MAAYRIFAKTPVGNAQKFYMEVVLSYEDDECLTWPFNCNNKGYACLRQNGRQDLVSRRVCEAIYGPPPTPEHEAAHSCGKGASGCVTKGHLSWKTHAENEADKLIHETHIRGERHPLAKLTEPEVREIRRLKGSMTQREIGELFGVNSRTVFDIQRGVTWGWL